MNQQPDLQDESVSPTSQDSSFADILSEFEQAQNKSVGGDVPATVISISDEYVVLDLGRKMEGVLPLASAPRNSAGELALKPGDPMVVRITGSVEGYYLLSLVKQEIPKDWSGLERAFAEKKIVAGTVTGVVKGGVTVDVGVRAFMPASRSGTREEADLLKLVGESVSCYIIKLDVEKEDVVVDRRAVLEEEEARAKQAALDSLQEGAVVSGTVRSLTDFGAFVNIGPSDGLLHVSDMSWGRIGKPSELLGEGQDLQVKILKIDREARKISLGLKQLQPDPWSEAEAKYQPEQRVNGKVVRLTDFGAFVELEPGLEGLIHVSELSWSKKVRKPSDVLKTGELVEALVLAVKPGERRISLGLKQVLGDPFERLAEKYPVGATVEGPVISLVKFGAFVDLGEGIDGMIHIGDITHEKRLNHPQEALKVGQVVKAMVLEVDRERRRLKLGMKQLEPTAIDLFIAEHKEGDVLSGRILEAGKDRAKVEVGEGIVANCRIPREEKSAKTAESESRSADLSSLTAMLAAKWKAGSLPTSSQSQEGLRPGQVRSVRIVALDPGQKRVEVELAQ